jgi:hypothetical protein
MSHPLVVVIVATGAVCAALFVIGKFLLRVRILMRAVMRAEEAVPILVGLSETLMVRMNGDGETIADKIVEAAENAKAAATGVRALTVQLGDLSEQVEVVDRRVMDVEGILGARSDDGESEPDPPRRKPLPARYEGA